MINQSFMEQVVRLSNSFTNNVIGWLNQKVHMSKKP
uniref:Uncharacterized protein n=1 Tax=Rhizophora mucronata TaxID=61149 RepID=A0A2P2R008_RHIMU